MKRLLLTAILLSPLILLSQTVVKKPVMILQMGPVNYMVFVFRDVEKGDTSYSFIYQDRTYPALLPDVTQVLTKDQLVNLLKCIELVKTSGSDDIVQGDAFSISKQKVGFGTMQYKFIRDGIFTVNEKHLRQLEEMIQKEIVK